MRPSGRKANELRQIILQPGVNNYAEGSCMVSYGNTKVLCTASIEERLPPWLKDSGKGWVTAEYGMLPRSTHKRNQREAAKGSQSGRTQEIQRLIGRSLRAVVDLKAMGERQITVDCDVIQADGGTRTASITGGFVALRLAINSLMQQGKITTDPVFANVAAVSCGIYKATSICDLDYDEDSTAEADVNFVLTSKGGIVEVQGTAEAEPFSRAQLNELMDLAENAAQELFRLQNTCFVP